MRKIFTGAFFVSVLLTQAQEPAANPTNMQFSAVKHWSAVMSYTPPQGVDGFIVLRNISPVTDVPQDGVTYERGQGIGSSKVIHVGGATIIPVRELVENTTYHFAVFAYNGYGTNINYKQSDPLTGSLTTPASDPGAYYQSIDTAAPDFLTKLTTLLQNHTFQSYTPGYATNVIPNLFERDTINNQKVINCEYTNETTIYTPPFSFSTLQYNREHVLCKSWMKTYSMYGNNITDYPEGADYFNLLLTKAAPNQARSNNPLGIVLNTQQTFGPSKFGTDNTGNLVFEPPLNRKGDAARAMFYEIVCYNGKSGNWGFDFLLSQGPEQNVNVLKLWHQQDPPDKFERTKNELFYSLQNNRNPFIDHPAWVNCINFDSLLKTAACSYISSSTHDAPPVWRCYPIPADNYLQIELPDASHQTLKLYDISGKLQLELHVSSTLATIDVSQLNAGLYILELSHKYYATPHRQLILLE